MSVALPFPSAYSLASLSHKLLMGRDKVLNVVVPRKLAVRLLLCPWRREWLPTPVFSPTEFHGQRNLASYSPCGGKESDMTQ